jgi:hypothetical protein
MNPREENTRYLDEIFINTAMANREAVVGALISLGTPVESIHQDNCHVKVGAGRRHAYKLYLKTGETQHGSFQLRCSFFRRNAKAPKSTQDLVDCEIYCTMPGKIPDVTEYPAKRKGQFNVLEIAKRILELQVPQLAAAEKWTRGRERAERHERDRKDLEKRLAKALRVPKQRYNWRDGYEWGEYLRRMVVETVDRSDAEELPEDHEEQVNVTVQLDDYHDGKHLTIAGLAAVTTMLRNTIPQEITTEIRFRSYLHVGVGPMTEAQALMVIPAVRSAVDAVYPVERDELPEWPEEGDEKKAQADGDAECELDLSEEVAS